MGVSENTETLRREVLVLRGELARERARSEALRIAYEAELAEVNYTSFEAAPLAYAWATRTSQSVLLNSGGRSVAVALGPERDYPGGIDGIWSLVQHIVDEG